MKFGFKYVKPSEGCGFVLIVCITNDKFIMKFVYWRWPRSWAMVGGEIQRISKNKLNQHFSKHFSSIWCVRQSSSASQSDHACLLQRRTPFLASKRSGDFRALQDKWRVTPDENGLSVHTKSTQIPLVIKRMNESCTCDPAC
jgi:hypothetical protein